MPDTFMYVRTESGHDAAAVLTWPDGDVRGALLLASPGASPRFGRNGHWRRVAHDVASLGIATMRIDYPGIGLSAGSTFEDFRESLTPAPMLDTLRPAFAALQTVAPGVPMLIAGECLGARGCLTLAAELDEPLAALLIDPLFFPQNRSKQGPAPTTPPKPKRARRGPVWLLSLAKMILRPVRILQKRRRLAAPGGDADPVAIHALTRAVRGGRITVVCSAGEPTAEDWGRLHLRRDIAAKVEVVDEPLRIHNFATLLAQARGRSLMRDWIERELAR